jgi:hypothetical protein
MSITCSIYGLGLQVNVPIAGLAGLRKPNGIDVRMTIGAMPPDLEKLPDGSAQEYYVSPYLDEHDQPGVRASSVLDARYHRIVYSDGTTIVVDAGGSNVWATGPDSATVEDTATYLLGPILGFVLRLRGVTCLHASAIAVDGQAIALVGPSGAGKSSTAAAFARLGYPVMTDDVLALSDLGDRFDVQPAYPRVRLWAEAVSSIFGSADALPLITPNWDKRFLDLNGPGCRFQQEPLPLAAIYFLGERSEPSKPPHVEAVSSRVGLMTLVSDTYITYLLDPPRRAQEFEFLGRLVASVPLRQVTPSADINRISELCETIVDDFRKIPERP